MHSSSAASYQNEMQLCVCCASSKDYSVSTLSRCAKLMWLQGKLCAKLSHWLNLNSGTQPKKGDWSQGIYWPYGLNTVHHPRGCVCTHQNHLTKLKFLDSEIAQFVVMAHVYPHEELVWIEVNVYTNKLGVKVLNLDFLWSWGKEACWLLITSYHKLSSCSL